MQVAEAPSPPQAHGLRLIRRLAAEQERGLAQAEPTSVPAHQVGDLRRLGRRLGNLSVADVAAAAGHLPIGEGSQELFPAAAAGGGIVEHGGVASPVGRRHLFQPLPLRPAGMQQQRLGRPAVTPGTACLLQVRLDRWRRVQVDGGADVTLVHAHPVGGGRDQHPVGRGEEPLLDGAPLIGVQAGVIEAGGGDAGGLQVAGVVLGATAAGREGDLRARHSLGAFDQGALLRQHLPHRVAQIGAIGVDRHDGHGGIGIDHLPDAPEDAGAGGGGEGAHDRYAGRPDHRAQLHVGGPEAVPPLRDAVCFVDHAVGDAQTGQQLPEAAGKGLRGGEQHVDLPLGQPVQDLPAFRLFLRAHECGDP